MAEQLFETKYGPLILEVESLLFKTIFYTLKEVRIPAGTKLRNGSFLKTEVKLRSGTILIPRTDENYPEQTRWQIFPYGIYEAIRACLNIRDNYENKKIGEIVFLESAYENFYQFISQLLQYRKLTPEEKKKIEKQLDEWRSFFKNPLNPLKQEIKNHLEGAEGLIDSRGRVNPGMVMARLTASRRYISLRLEEIRQIDPRIGTREIALLLEKNRIERLLARVWHQLKRTYTPSGMEYSVIKECKKELAQIKIGPFPSSIERMCRELEETINLLNQRRYQEAALLVCRVLESIRVKKARSVLEEIILQFELSRRDSSKSPSETEKRFIPLIDNFLNRWKKIDDSNFEVPVKEKIYTLLNQAKDSIRNNQLEISKELLKKAARLL
jgi:hypothetical protein